MTNVTGKKSYYRKNSKLFCTILNLFFIPAELNVPDIFLADCMFTCQIPAILKENLVFSILIRKLTQKDTSVLHRCSSFIGTSQISLLHKKKIFLSCHITKLPE